MGTLGKAAGVAGAFVAADPVVIDWLVNKARSYIFTTAASPVIAATLAESVNLLAAGEARRPSFSASSRNCATAFAGTRWQLCDSPSAIQPIIVGDNHEALALAEALFDAACGCRRSARRRCPRARPACA